MTLDVLPPCSGSLPTGMAYSLFSEIAERLEALDERDETSSIDLRSIPLTQADLQDLEELLGRGEITVSLELAGKTEVWETEYSGVWWIRHRGGGERIATQTIEVSRIPEILMTHPVDVKSAASRIRRDLEQEVDQDVNFAGRRKSALETSNVRE